MVQILLLWFNTISNSCPYNVDMRNVGEAALVLTKDKKALATEQLLSITGLAWFTMHVIGGILRSMMYMDPHFENPDHPEDNVVTKLLCE